MSIQITDIEYYLPGRPVTNGDLQKLHPTWDMPKLAEKSGVFQRHFAGKNETSLDLSLEACERLFARHPGLKESLDGILYCTQSPDYIMPSNAFLLQKHFRLKQSIFAFDFNLACSGFIYGLAIARGFVASGMAKNILFVTADTYSKYIHPRDRSAMILFGDGAAATLITKTEGPGILDMVLASSGKDFEPFYIPAGGCRTPKSPETAVETVDASGNAHTLENIHMNGFAVWKFIASTVPKQITELLVKNNVDVSQVDLFVFHQASKMTLESLVKSLKIDPGKVFGNIGNVGNLVSASIPAALKGAEEAGRLKRGDLVLLSGFGVGLSWGTILLRY